MIVLVAGVLPTATASGFCSKGVVRDYGAPLKSMPPISAAPIDEHLPFGPSRVFLGRVGSGPLLTGDQRTGFSLSYASNAQASPELNWSVQGRLIRVDLNGNPLGPVGERRLEVSRLNSSYADPSARLDLSFDTAGPGLYLSEVAISDQSGVQLARYGEYVRVLKPRMKVRLNLNRTTFGRGQRIVPRLDNYGTTNLSFGLIGAAYQRHDGADWVPAAFGNGPKFAIRLWAGPGKSAACWAVRVPKDAPPGRYRFALHIDFDRNRFLSRKRGKVLFAKFTIGSNRLVVNDPIG